MGKTVEKVDKLVDNFVDKSSKERKNWGEVGLKRGNWEGEKWDKTLISGSSLRKDQPLWGSCFCRTVKGFMGPQNPPKRIFFSNVCSL